MLDGQRQRAVVLHCLPGRRQPAQEEKAVGVWSAFEPSLARMQTTIHHSAKQDSRHSRQRSQKRNTTVDARAAGTDLHRTPNRREKWRSLEREALQHARRDEFRLEQRGVAAQARAE